MNRRHFLASAAVAALAPGLSLRAALEGKFFTLAQRKGRWWLIKPDGGPFFSLGLNHIDPASLRYPETLILHGKKDTTVPYASVVAFESVMKKAGRPCKLVGYDGAGHGFFNRGEDFPKTLAEADRFLVDLGWIKK